MATSASNFNSDGIDLRALSHFRSIPWCARHISDPDFILTVTTSRRPRARPGDDNFFSSTLHTPSTVSECLALYRQPTTITSSSSSSSGSAAPRSDSPRCIHEVRMLLSLGTGLNGHPSICHGGVICVLMDEAMGFLLSVNKNQGHILVERDEAGGGGGVVRQQTTMTATLDTRFVRAVRTPSTVLARAWFKDGSNVVEGRRCGVEAAIEDEDGAVLATAEAVFVVLGERARERLKL